MSVDCWWRLVPSCSPASCLRENIWLTASFEQSAMVVRPWLRSRVFPRNSIRRRFWRLSRRSSVCCRHVPTLHPILAGEEPIANYMSQQPAMAPSLATLRWARWFSCKEISGKMFRSFWPTRRKVLSLMPRPSRSTGSKLVVAPRSGPFSRVYVGVSVR